MISKAISLHELRPFWRKMFQFDWKFGLFLLLLICIPRFFLVLQANSSGNYSSIGLIMLISALAPYLFLSRNGRRRIGLTKPSSYTWLGAAFFTGLIFSILLYFLGESLYGNSYQNWYNYIGRSYKIPAEITPKDKSILFTIVAITGMTFSPIGEELFFRGIVHSSFAASIGERKASFIDALAFAAVHISHFGLVFINAEWQFMIMPTILWVVSMFLVSLLFIYFRKRTDSILGAILCHAAFNLGMIYCIFYLS